jgi:probable phosphoglycerate mutase
VLCSPLQRARRTCELAGLGGQASIDPDLVEWNYGSYEGLTPAAIREQHPGWLVFRDGCPAGESPAEMGERVDRVISRVRQNGGRVALFAHGHVFRVFVARWIELSPSHGAHFLLDTSTLTILSYYRGIPAVKCWNAALVASAGC